MSFSVPGQRAGERTGQLCRRVPVQTAPGGSHRIGKGQFELSIVFIACFTLLAFSLQVQVYDPSSTPQDPVKTFTKFRDRSYGGRLRRDGRLMAVGGEEGAARLFELDTKTQLRCFQGHSRAIRRCERWRENEGRVPKAVFFFQTGLHL